MLALVLLAVVALLAPQAATAASSPTYPAITKVAPKTLGIGDTLTITGRNFRAGASKNTVVFRREGGRAMFVTAVPKATTRTIKVVIPAKLLPQLVQQNGRPVKTRFRIRVLARRFGRTYTSRAVSPVIGPLATQAAGSADDCDADGVKNATDLDDDNDGLTDVEEGIWKTDPCKRDSDGDGMSDLWETQSALDRSGKTLAATAARPVPNPLDKDDAAKDSDGDGLTNAEEYAAWATYGGGKLRADRPNDPFYSRLTYSGGNPNSDGRDSTQTAEPRIPGASPGSDTRYYLDRDGNGFLSDLERDADGDGISNVDEERRFSDGNASGVRCLGTKKDGDDPVFYSFGLFTSSYVTQCAAKETLDQGSTVCAGINQVPFYCLDKAEGSKVDTSKVDTIDWLAADTDGDGVKDGDDDVDHDDVANLTELLDELRAPLKNRSYRQLDACQPNLDSRFCVVGAVDVDGDGILNRDDDDDDGDALSDAKEREIGTNPLLADTDKDGASDGFEYYSALDLNKANLPYPGKRPYPNALFADSNIDYDGDVLTLLEEYKAWRYTGGKLPLTYSDGQQATGGGITDDLRDVDNDGANNYLETHGPLSGPEWWNAWIASRANKCNDKYTETPYPGPDLSEPKFEGLNFVDPDTDGDGIKDGADDIDHDGLTNLQEAFRPANWCSTYVSVGPVFGQPDDLNPANGGRHDGSDPNARVQPFNPCKPLNSAYCHRYAPNGYYKEEQDAQGNSTYIEDWKGPDPS